MNARKLGLSILATLCAFASLLALGSAPASAYFKHEYLSRITGTPESPFKEICGVAIDPADQYLLVADFGNEAVDIFDSEGTYQSRISGSGRFLAEYAGDPEKCNVAVSKVTGDVYVAESQVGVVYVYGPLGNYLEELNGATTPNGSFGSFLHVAVDESSGDIYVTDYRDGVLDRFNKENEYQSQLTGLAQPVGLAVAANGDVYVGGEAGVLQEFNASGAEIDKIAGIHGEPASIAVDSNENVYVAARSDKGVVDEYSSTDVLESQIKGTPTQGFEFPSGIVVNAAGDLYVSVGADVDVFGPNLLVPDVGTGAPSKLTGTTATLNGTVNAKGTQVTSCEFEYGLTSAYAQTAACEQAPVGSSPVAVSANLKDLQAGTEYHYRLVARNSNGYNESEDATFFTLGPQVQQELFTKVSQHSTTVNAQINPEGLSTTYTVEYGTSEAYGSTTPATSIGAGSGFINIAPTLGTSIASILQPGTTYHFRVAATNANGTKYGTDVTFATLSGFTGLPDGRGYELVSPLANADGDVYPPESEKGFDELVAPSPTRAAADGNAVEYVADRLTTGGVSGANAYVAVHDSGGGWSPPVDLSTPGFDGVPFEALFANELSNSGTGSAPVGTHVLISNGKGLFDSVGGRMLAVSVLPEGSVVSYATFGSAETENSQHTRGEGKGTDFSHAVSADGSRIFWTDLEEGPDMEHLFVRENDSTTVPVSLGAAQFRVASSDGRYVFYTEQQRLLRFDTESGSREELAGAGSGVLGVVGVNETGEDGAYVYFAANGVLGDGAEHGALQGNCTVDYIREGSPQGNCNLYVDHDGVTAFIATLLPEDIDFDGNAAGVDANIHSVGTGVAMESLQGRTAEVSADGQAVVFESRARLTGYENDNVFEAFVYNAGSGQLSCVSCNPTGEPITGATVFQQESTVLRGSDSELWTHRWISEDGTRVFFESREGLVAQDTNGEKDVYEWEQDGTGSCEDVKGCVYLLSGGTSSDNSYFLDASASGNDVFMISRAGLVPQDQGDTYEVWDARVDATEALSEPVCTGTGCQGLPAGPPLFATPSSVTFAGVGNFSPGTASAPAKKAKVKGKVPSCRKGTHKHNGKCVKSKAVKKVKAGKSIHGKGSK